MIDLGWTVWSAERGKGLDETDQQIDPIGGVVVEVREREEGTEYVTVHPDTLARRTLRADELVPDPEPPETTRITRTVRRLAGRLAFAGPGREWKRKLTDAEVEAVVAMHRLVVGVICRGRLPDRWSPSPDLDTPPPAPGSIFVD